MPANRPPRDRFDDVARDRGRVGAHRAENPRMRIGLVVLWAALATLVLFVVGVLGTLVLSGRVQLPWAESSTPTPTAVATTEAPPAIDPTFQVLVLNASPDTARTDAVRQQVVDAGYPAEAVQTADAEQTDFETTTVYYADEADLPAARALAAAIGVADIAQSDAYRPADPAMRQLTVVIGADATG